MRRARARWVLVLVLLVGASYPVSAQVAGRITGSVVDATGAGVPNAKVSLFLQGGGSALLTTQTTSDGLITIPAVRPEYYDVVIEAPGFDSVKLPGIKVDPSKETAIPQVTLQVAATTTFSVDVVGHTAIVQTSTAEVAVTITRTQVDTLPVLDRQVNFLFNTQAGVTAARTATTINGLRPSYTNLLLDGVNVQDSVRTNPLDFVPNRLTIGQIADITMATANVNPTIGGNANTISLTTPSGTNEYHGNAYWYNRNSFFGANDWFNNQSGIARPFLNLNQLGGSIGGPAIKDKLFFYSNYEAYRMRQTTPVQRTILTPEARQGILRYRNAAGQTQSFNVLSNQQTPPDPFVQSLLRQTPAEGNFAGLGDNLNTTGYSFNARNNTTRDNVTGKVDYYLSTSHTFSGSYIFNRDVQDRPTSGSFYTLEPPIYNDNLGNFFSAAWRWNPAPAMTNELRGGLNRVRGTFKRRTDLPAFFVANNSNNLPLIFNSPVNETLPEGRDTNSYSIQDNATWIKGKHSLAFGFQATLWRTAVFGYGGTVPTYTLSINSANIPQGFALGDIPGASASDTNTANRLLAALGGLISHSGQTFNITSPTSGFVPGAPYNYHLNMNNLAPYFNDTWKIRRNLTLNLGLRYEYFSPVDEPNGLYIQPRTPSGNYIDALLGNPTIDFVPGGMYNPDRNNWAPNAGFAWDVFGTGRTAVRGAYSIAYANDNNINSAWITYTANNGLSSNLNAANLNGTAGASPPPIKTPPFGLPTTLRDQFNLSPSSAPVEGVIDPNLRMPYTQQWNLSVEHEWKGYLFTARYLGNNTTGQLRQIDYNQINVFQDTFLQDFKAARNNGFLARQQLGRFDPRYNPAVSGSRPLPFFDKLPRGALLTNPGVVGLIQTGEIGTLGQTYQSNLLFPYAGFSYFPNPLALYSSLLANAARSNYNSGQFEVARRMRGGVHLQANYTFSKAISTAAAFRGLEAQLDNNNRSLERARSPYDLAHAFKLNHYVPLPFGKGQRFDPGNRLVNFLAGGWALSGFLIIQSGQPVSVLSNRGTLNRGPRSTGVATANTIANGDELRETTGLFKNGNGVYWIDPRHIGPDGRGVAPDGQAPFEGQLFSNPGPGDVGGLQRRYLDGPGFWNYNFSVQKDTKFTERQSIQFRVDFYNLFNHPNFWPSTDLAGGDHNINSTSFGRITSMTGGGDGVSTRLVQFGLFYKF
ncbi:MAG: TonB-dependent receptor [Bryobacterales bacterium]|nr:TonB-dependent receptor [Bryobacterales bacterium]